MRSPFCGKHKSISQKLLEIEPNCEDVTRVHPKYKTSSFPRSPTGFLLLDPAGAGTFVPQTNGIAPVWNPEYATVAPKVPDQTPPMALRSRGLGHVWFLAHSLSAKTEAQADMLLVYNISFGLVHVNSNAFFTLRIQSHLRGHKMS